MRKVPGVVRRGAAVASIAALVASPMAFAQSAPYETSLAPVTSMNTLPEDRGAAALWQTLRKLNTWASMMVIVAHPDDEDGGMMAYESRGSGARVALMTLTRGEGGQNAMSGDSYDALGLIRTQELLRADQFYGAEQYWGTVADFGFSKTQEEAFEKWGHDRVLYDVVRVIRMNRPLVLSSSFVGGITDGHGHHQVSGEISQEAFLAAGDPNVFPDQIKAGLRAWSPRKVYSREPFFSVGPKGMYDYATGKWAPARFYNYVDKTWSDKQLATNLSVPAGTYDPVLGRAYFQIARQGWGEQKSQHSEVSPPLPGTVNSAYHRWGSRLESGDKENSFFDGIDTSLMGIATLAKGENPWLVEGLRGVRQHVVNAMLGYIPSAPDRIAPKLHDGYLATQKLMDAVTASALTENEKADINHELGIKLVQFNTALAEALGLELAAMVTPSSDINPSRALSLTPEDTFSSATPGQKFRVRVHLSSPSAKATLKRTWLASPEGEHWTTERVGAPGLDDVNSRSGDVVYQVTVPLGAAATRPYFSRPSTDQSYYDILDPRWRNLSFAPYPLAGWAEFDYNGVPVRLGGTVQTVRRVQAVGRVFEPLMVTPALSVSASPSAGIVPLPDKDSAVKDFKVSVVVHNDQADKAVGTVKLELPPNWVATPAQSEFTLQKSMDDAKVSFTVHPVGLAAAPYTIRAVAQSGNYSYSEGYQRIGYAGLLPYNLYHPATYQLRGVDVKVAPDLKVAYIMGTGDEVPQALESLGIEPHLLSAQELAGADLSRYNTIVLGIRAYAARPELAQANRRLLEYVHNGGCLVVQYNLGEFDHNYGPYPFTLGSAEKVVDEKAEVSLTDGHNPLLNWPNQLASADFDGWVEERGHGFLESWDSRYSSLTETHDPGQDPQKGGLLVARYGKGTYVYMAFAVYRQLPEAVPGAYRLLANLISAGKNPGGATKK